MAFRIETRQEMLSGFRYAAIIEEQKQFGYFLGSWVFSDVDDAAKAAKTREEILGTKNVKEDKTAEYVVKQVLNALDDSAWRWYQWATKWTLYYTMQELASLQNGQTTSEEYQTRLNGLVENLITQVNHGSANQIRMDSKEQYSQWDPQQLEQWNKENNQGDRLQGSKFYNNNVIYTFENGWTMVQLKDERDSVMVGEELKNCVRHEAPNGWKNHPGIIALVDPEGKPKAVARFGGDGRRIISPGEPQYMKVCYEFQSQKNGQPVIAYDYGEYLFEFLNKTTPEQLGFEGKAWENESLVQKPHDIIERYQQGEKDFQDMKMPRANLNKAVLFGANLSGADLTAADLFGANLKEANLRGANLSDADLTGANLTAANLFRADLFHAALTGAALFGADLCEANLKGAKLRYAKLFGAKLRYANLRGADLWKARLFRADLSGANLSDAALFDADLSYANLRGADLSGSDLPEAKLSAANLTGADLSGSWLNRADLTGANLKEANLSAADLRGANLTAADLSGANLRGAALRGIIYDQSTTWPEGFTPPKSSPEGFTPPKSSTDEQDIPF